MIIGPPPPEDAPEPRGEAPGSRAAWDAPEPVDVGIAPLMAAPPPAMAMPATMAAPPVAIMPTPAPGVSGLAEMIAPSKMPRTPLATSCWPVAERNDAMACASACSCPSTLAMR
jgi:hypothetical protein